MAANAAGATYCQEMRKSNCDRWQTIGHAIPGVVKAPNRLAPFAFPVMQVVQQRFGTGRAHIGVLLQIP